MENLEIVQQFIQNFWGIKDKKRLQIDTNLSDLGFYGDDKLEFVQKFFNDFDIDFSDFEEDKYIEPEKGFLSPINLIKRVFSSKKEDEVKEIKIKDLVLALENKKWINNLK